MKRPLLALALSLAALLAYGADFGAALGLSPKVSEDGFSISMGLTPWLSSIPAGGAGADTELYLSAALTLSYKDDAWSFGFAPRRFDILLKPAAGTSIRIGRQNYADSAGMIASGLYDGFSLNSSWGSARLSLASLYAGLLDKNGSTVVMSGADLSERADTSVYFAPPRALMAASLSFPGTVTYFVDAIAQFDARGSGALNSQYLSMGLRGSSADALSYELALVNGFVEEEGEVFSYSLAGKTSVSWLPPGPAKDRLYGSLRYASGELGFLSPYLSVNAIPQGQVFAPRLAGLFVTQAGYDTRLSAYLSAELQSSAFLRSNEGGPADSGLDPSSDSLWLGFEVYGALRWAPYSDLNILFGSGLFVPGAAFLETEPLRWLAALSIVLAM
ncbi:MAG TPA: hypothetical protein DCG47_03020 [Spirochaetaceae bacterium]|jgi:hypothetical protein|nr:hypothetical protein [Spirochaetaceae bacterium]